MPFLVVAVPFTGRWYFDRLIDGITAAAREQGLAVRVIEQAPGPTAHREVAEVLSQQLRDPGCRGAVPVLFDLDAEDAALLPADRPVVVIGGRSGGLPSVFIDDVAAARQATEHLLGLGHTSVAHLAGYTTAPDDFSMRRDRVRGYSDAMGAAGLGEGCRIVPSGFDYGDARRAARRLLSDDERPTAVFAVSDEVAFAVLDTAAELGLSVPGDLSVVGIDDHEDAMGRGLTTLRQRPEALGRAAVARLLGHAGEDDRAQDVVLVVRGTTDAPGRGAPAAPPGALRRLVSRVAPRRR